MNDPLTITSHHVPARAGSKRNAIALTIAFLGATLTGCKTNEPLRPEGYALGKRVRAPFAQMIANAHPEPVLLEPVTFPYDSAELTEETCVSLQASAKRIRETQRPVYVFGHADFNNTEEYNDRLGLERAVAVRDYLWHCGVPKDWMGVRSRGKLDPAASNLTPEGRALNRRVELVMQPFGPGRTAEENLRMLEGQRGEDAAGGSGGESGEDTMSAAGLLSALGGSE